MVHMSRAVVSELNDFSSSILYRDEGARVREQKARKQKIATTRAIIRR